jgi:hypothetical protein
MGPASRQYNPVRARRLIVPLNLDSCITGIFVPGNIGASSGLTPVEPVMPLRPAGVVSAAIVETAHAADLQAWVLSVIDAAIVEAATATDAASAGLSNTAAVVETATATDAPDGNLDYTASVAEAATAVDTLSASVLATLNGTTANTTVSGGGLIATHTNTVGNSGVTSSTSKTAGKWYFEGTFTTTHGASDCVATILAGASFANLITNGTNCTAVYAGTGNIWSNNANSTKTLGAIVTGDVVGVAVDLTARLGWFRKLHSGTTGNWNGDPTANPATGTGGVTIAATLAASPVVGFGGASTATNDIITANFGQSAYAMTAPSGFSNWA